MANYKKHDVTVTTVTNAGTGYTPVINGRILSVQYTKTDYTDGVVFTITGETSGRGIWTETAVNASKTVYPTILTQDQVGVDATARDFIYLVNERVKIAVTVAGDAETGAFTVLVA